MEGAWRKRKTEKNEHMERVKRFELSTSSLARKRSSQLSYTREIESLIVTEEIQKCQFASTDLFDLNDLRRYCP
jgi:hypothetical protein